MTNQWFENSSSIPGQTNLFLVLTDLSGGTNTYYLKVSNAYGSTNTVATVVQVPAGHSRVTLRYERTSDQTWGLVVSGISLVVLLWMLFSGARTSGRRLASA